MSLLSRLLATFALGLIATGLIVGFISTGPKGCGPAFSHGYRFGDTDACDEARAQRRGLPIALIGLGLTTSAAAVVAGAVKRSPAPRSAPADRGSAPA